jgi:predicted Zn-dependent protease
MSSWSRREVLAALAAAGAAPGWLELLSGCGSAGRPASRGPIVTSRPMADLRQQLREVVGDLGRRFRTATGQIEVAHIRLIGVDAGGRSLADQRHRTLVLAASDGAAWYEQSTGDLSPVGIREAAEALAARQPNAGRTAPRPAAPKDDPGPRLRLDPRKVDLAGWFERASALHDRMRRLGGSRIVYRAASVEIDDRDRLFVGDGHDLATRVVRTRTRALFLAWDGETLLAEEAHQGGAAGLELSEISDQALAAAVGGALSLLTGRTSSPGERDLVLDPSVAALVLRHGIATGLEADSWLRGSARASALVGKGVAPASFALRDDPTASGAFGGYVIDDEGWPAAPAGLIDGGVLRGPLTCRATAAALGMPRTGHARRADPLGPAAPRPAHLVLRPGASSADALVSSVSDGFLVEGGASGRGDARSWRFAVQARRAREIANGRLTGRSYGPVVVGGDALSLLAETRAAGDRPAGIAWREEAGPVSVSTPHLLTRAWLGRGS